jgi:uncharacterized membrane protein YeaQ/YmgE (transglycosylase-associated protein family)
MTSDHVLLFLVIGVLVGFFAGKIIKGSGFGIVGDMALGILGSFVGVWLFGELGMANAGVLGSLAAGTAGALLLLFVIRSVRTA